MLVGTGGKAADYSECLRACAEGRPCVRIVLPLRGGAAQIGRRGMVGPFYYQPGWVVFATRVRFSTSMKVACGCRMRRRAVLQPGGTHAESQTSHLRCDVDDSWMIVYLQVLTTFDNQPKQLRAGVANLQLLPTLLFLFPLIFSVLAATSMPVTTTSALAYPFLTAFTKKHPTHCLYPRHTVLFTVTIFASYKTSMLLRIRRVRTPFDGERSTCSGDTSSAFYGYRVSVMPRRYLVDRQSMVASAESTLLIVLGPDGRCWYWQYKRLFSFSPVLFKDKNRTFLRTRQTSIFRSKIAPVGHQPYSCNSPAYEQF